MACVRALRVWSCESENLNLYAGRFAVVLLSHGYTLARPELISATLTLTQSVRKEPAASNQHPHTPEQAPVRKSSPESHCLCVLLADSERCTILGHSSRC